MTDHHDIRDADLEAPATLLADLRSLYGAPREVPAEVDDTIRRAVWRHFAATPRARIVRYLFPLAAAAAAAAILAILPLSRESIPGDIDGNGEVDILDAFALARRMEATEKIEGGWDMNADGLVDEVDVDLIAAVAVALW
ncbi:hypothetical protein JXA88_02020 [Candidatus Fermentibacteria bacterium]|nr:hypothetical protein [Candidatus Fermentibacteria bacterium]